MESAVQVAQRWILAVLRHHRFFSLSELNEAIREQLERLNARPMQKLGVSRRELYERLDRPALRPLPVERYELARWKPCTVDNDYHVEVDGSHYSVPYQLIGEGVEVRTTAFDGGGGVQGKACCLASAKKSQGGTRHDP